MNLYKFNKLKTLIVLNQINSTTANEAWECIYSENMFNHVTFYGNILKQIDDYMFPVFPALRFSLTNNKIERITKGAFSDHQVVQFDVSDNLLEVVETNALPSTNVTKAITIKNNRLTHLEPDCFPTSLTRLNLENNKLRYIEENILGSLVNLLELVLSKNKLKAIPKLTDFKNLVNFQMAFNEISVVTSKTFKDLKYLKYIDLSNNNIADINIIFTINTPLKHPSLVINLALNRLRDLNLKDVDHQKQIYVLYGNPFNCLKWNDILKVRGKSESDCEEKFVSSGKIPFCLDFNYLSTLNAANDLQIDAQLKIVRKQEETFECNVIPDMEHLLNNMHEFCVA